MLFLLIKFKNILLIKLRKDLANKAIQEEEIITIGDKKEEIADLLEKIEIEIENIIIKNIMNLQVKMKIKVAEDSTEEMVLDNTEEDKEEIIVVEVVVVATIEGKTEVVEEIIEKIKIEAILIILIQDRINLNATIKKTITITIIIEKMTEVIVVIIMSIDSTNHKEKKDLINSTTKMKNHTKEDKIELNKIDLEIVI